MSALKPGSKFKDRYAIVRRLGGGGMGEVYLARDLTDPEFFVALKVVNPGILNTPSVRERFRNEIVAAYKISHPNIVKAYEYFDGAEIQAYAMEYVSGGDLLTRIKRDPITARDAARCIRQIASALETIHGAGIVHRDLKPENILLTADNEAKIADFGVARVRGAQTLTQAGGMVGTPRYLAPEYVETGECDHRGDIYALGVIGYEMLSGVSPFPVDSRELLLARRSSLKVPSLLKLAPHCPTELAIIIEKAMSANLARRYQSAEELRRDLDRFELGESLLPESAPSTEPPSRFGLALDAPPTPRRFTPPRIAAAASTLTLFCALIVLIAYPSIFGSFAPKKHSAPPAVHHGEGEFDPQRLGEALLQLAHLERQLAAESKKRGEPIEPGPAAVDAHGALSPHLVEARIGWLEAALNRNRPPQKK